MSAEVIITQDVPFAFAHLVKEACESRRESDRFSLALSGGSTAYSCYSQLAKESIDWSVVVAVWGDERCVPLDHEDSNYALAKAAFLDQVTPLADVHPMDCTQGVDAYESKIAGLAPLDFVHLGMGDDGHTASLFPGSPALDEPEHKLVVATGDDLHPHPRMSLTFSAINSAELVAFTVMGKNKREMFERVQNGEDLPATRVSAKRVVWIVDPDVAG